MGKSSKKLNRKKQQQYSQIQQKANKEAERNFDLYYAERKYAEALNYLAEMIQGKDINPEYLYKGAVCYYMQTDYDRAVQWVYNTLSFVPGHVDARILLARICCQQNRQADGFAILETIVKNNESSLTDIQGEDIEEIVGVSCRNGGDRFTADYPALANFLKTETQSQTVASDTLSALKRLRDKLKRTDDSSIQQSPMQEEEKAGQTAVENSVADTIQQVKAKNVSVVEKIRLYNVFAAAAYVEDDFAGAESLLKEALLLDDKDERSIRNLAMTFAAQGDKTKALTIAGKLAEADFLLIKSIKEI